MSAPLEISAVDQHTSDVAIRNATKARWMRRMAACARTEQDRIDATFYAEQYEATVRDLADALIGRAMRVAS